MRRLMLLVVVALVAGSVACGDNGDTTGAASSTTPATPTEPATNPTPRPVSGDVLVAALGDSITAGSPLYDPDPAVREQIGSDLDVRSQYEYWYAAAHPRYRFRNCGIFGQRTDEIAQRLDACAKGARVLVVQGGINDIAQGRDVAAAARDITKMIREGKRLGLRVTTVQVLPWNNGPPGAAALIRRLNTLIAAAARTEGVPLFRWYAALDDPAAPGRMQKSLTDDGNHPSVEGYKRLAATMTLP